MLCACSSPSDLSLCSASQSLSISQSQSSNSAQILKSTENFLEYFWKFRNFLQKFRTFSGSSGTSPEVPNIFRKFWTSPEVPDFEFFHEIFSYPFVFTSSETTPFTIQNSLPVSLSLRTLSLSLTSLSLSPNTPPPQISGSSPNLRKFGSKCLQVDHLCLHCIPLGHLLKESRYCLMLPYWNFFPISLIRSNQLNPFGKDVNMFIMDVYSSFEGLLMVKTRVLRILRNLGLGFISNLILDQIF